MIRAIEVCPLNDIPLEIRTDSEYTIMCAYLYRLAHFLGKIMSADPRAGMTTYLPIWLKKGLLTRPGAAAESKIKNLDLIKHLFVLLRERRAGVKFKHVRGHAGLEGNEQADVSPSFSLQASSMTADSSRDSPGEAQRCLRYLIGWTGLTLQL